MKAARCYRGEVDHLAPLGPYRHIDGLEQAGIDQNSLDIIDNLALSNPNPNPDPDPRATRFSSVVGVQFLSLSDSVVPCCGNIVFDSVRVKLG